MGNKFGCLRNNMSSNSQNATHTTTTQEETLSNQDIQFQLSNLSSHILRVNRMLMQYGNMLMQNEQNVETVPLPYYQPNNIYNTYYSDNAPYISGTLDNFYGSQIQPGFTEFASFNDEFNSYPNVDEYDVSTDWLDCPQTNDYFDPIACSEIKSRFWNSEIENTLLNTNVCPICLDRFFRGTNSIIPFEESQDNINNLEIVKECWEHNDSPVEDKDIFLSSCGHFFHRGCIKTWITANTTCPECRGQLNLYESVLACAYCSHNMQIINPVLV